jgi:hypothetical protein
MWNLSKPRRLSSVEIQLAYLQGTRHLRRIGPPCWIRVLPWAAIAYGWLEFNGWW